MRNLSLLLLIAAASTAEHRIPVREGTHQVYGSTTVYVGPYNWPPHPPQWNYSKSSGVLEPRWDFPAVTCDPATDVCRAVCPAAWSCESQTGHNLPDGTEVVLTTSGALPSPLKSWAQDRWKRYYIRDSTVLTFRLAGVRGGSAIDITSAGAGTHGMSFAGYTHAVVLEGGRSKNFTCQAGTELCTSAGHGLSNDQNVKLTSTGALPAGLKQRYGSVWAKNCVTVVDSNRFKLRWQQNTDTACSAATSIITFGSAGSGTHAIWNLPGTVFLWSIAGYPAGTTFSYRRVGRVQMAAIIANSRVMFGESEPLTIYAKVPAVTPAGSYPVTITTSESSTNLSNPQTSGYPLAVKTLAPLSKAGPSSYPPLPSEAVARWEYALTNSDRGGGADNGTHGYPYPRCPNPENPAFDVGFPSNAGQNIWVYDGGASYYEMAEYFGHPVWRNCGAYIARDITESLLNVGTQGYLYGFTRTLQRAWSATGDPRFRVALLRISDTSYGHQNVDGTLNDFSMRQQAFSFARNLIRRRLTGSQRYFESDYVSSLAGMLDELSNGGTLYQFHQPFMAGLTMRELTDYYRDHNDERIPVIIKQYLDRFWTHWYDPATHQMYYNPDPEGSRCYTGCQTWSGQILNNLLSPGFAFVWRLTGDDLYRARADELFEYQFGNSFNTWPYQAKNWSEMNYWVWDYIRWRKGSMRAH